MKIKLKKLPKSQIEIDFELDEKEFAKYVNKALDHLKEHVKMDGFRKGHVPANMVEEKVGNENLLMEAGDLAVKDAYPKFIKNNNLEPISRPEVQILKIAKGSSFLFRVKVSVLPEIELPDYKEIASQIKTQEVSVDEKEIEDTINYLQKSRAKFITENRPAKVKDFVEIEYSNKDINSGKEVKDKFILGEGGFMKDFEDNILGMKAGEEKEFTAKFPDNAINNLGQDAKEAGSAGSSVSGKEGVFKVKIISVQKMELPEINDEFAKSIGAFNSFIDLKENIKESITIEKQESEKQRKRGEILNKITEKVFDAGAPILNKIGARPSTQSETLNALVPEKMVQYEQERLFEYFKNQITQNDKISFEDYLASIKKTEEEIKKSFSMEAEKRIKNFLVLRQIGKAENIRVSNEEIDEEISRLIKNYSRRPQEYPLDKIDIEQLKEYAKGTIQNEKIFQLLENLFQN